MHLRNILHAFSFILSDPSLFSHARILPHSFTREKGKMPLRYLLTYLVFRHGKTLSEDISTFYSSVRNLDIPSKQAVLKRMSILNYDVWFKIQQLFLERIYLPMKKTTLHGYLLIAIDGTFATLPDHPVSGMIFGRHESSKNYRGDPQAKVSVAYDVLNHVILDFRIAHQDVSEIPLMFQHLEALENILKKYKVIILADRYYGSAEFFKYCEMKGYRYIVRAKKNFFKKQRAELAQNCMDAQLDILIDRLWQKRIIREEIRDYIIKNPQMSVRLVKGHYEYDEEYITFKGKKIIRHIDVDSEYFTNLSTEEFSTDAIIDTYHKDRWRIETAYGTLKTFLDMEQLNSANPIVIMNELMAKLIYFNIENLIKKSCEGTDRQDTSYIINSKNIIELCHGAWFVSAFHENRFPIKRLNEFIKECRRHKILIRSGRHYKRWGKIQRSLKQRRHRRDGRNNPPLRITKAGMMTSNH